MHRLLPACLIVPALLCFGEARAADALDGVYEGTSTLLGAGSARCTQSFAFKLRVQDHAFQWTLPDKVQVPVPVAPDGTFNVQNGQRFLVGKIEGKQLTAKTTGRSCVYNWVFNRS